MTRLALVLGLIVGLANIVSPQRLNDPRSVSDIAFNLLSEGQVQRTEKFLQNFASSPDSKISLRAKLVLAELERQRGEIGKARGILNSIISAPSNEPSVRAEKARAYYQLAWCYLTQPNPDLTSALSTFQKAVKEFSDVKEKDEDGSSPVCKADFNIGLLLLRMGRKSEGISAIKEFISRHKDCCYLSFREREKLEEMGVLPKLGFLPSPVKTNGLLHRRPDCGPKALAMALKAMGVLNGRPVEYVAREIIKRVKMDRYGTTFEELAKVARSYDVKAKGIYCDGKALVNVPKPAIAWVNRSHFVTVLSASGFGRWTKVRFYDPAIGKEQNLPLSEFQRLWDGHLLVMEKQGQKLAENPSPLGFLAFLPLLSLILPFGLLITFLQPSSLQGWNLSEEKEG